MYKKQSMFKDIIKHFKFIVQNYTKILNFKY